MNKSDDCSPHVKLALEAISAYVNESRVVEPPTELPTELCGQAGVFVSLKKHGELRGCIGTIQPAQPTVAQEIIHNAINSATRDPRFLPVEPEELDLLTCSVDVLSQAEVIDSPTLLDPQKYGVIVECKERRGLLLPNLEGVDTVEEQIDIARRKGSNLA